MKAVYEWIDQPISALSCFAGWLVATIFFVGLIAFFGGPSQGDAYESVFSTWSIAHGQAACAFPSGFRVVAPLYPLISGGIAAVERVGSSAPFPTAAVQGPDCTRAFLAINSWSHRTSAIEPTIKIGYVSWLILVGGIVAYLRAIGRGRRRWEPAVLICMAVVPTVWMCLVQTFHPEDLLAVGFAIAAAAAARSNAWWAAGILISLAVLSQQFSLLVALPLLILAPSHRQRLHFFMAACGTFGLVVAALVLAGSTSVAHAAFLGTGNTGGIGGTVLWELQLRGATLVFMSRVLPILLAGLVACYAVWTLSSTRAREAVPLTSILATSFGLRLVFEQQLFGYYFMALSVTLILLCAAEGRIRISVVVWLAGVSLAYNEPFPTVREDLVTIVLVAIAFGLLTYAAFVRGPRWTDVAWAGLVVASLLTFKSAGVLGQPPTWLWQLVFVPTGIGLAVRPLLIRCRKGNGLAGFVRRGRLDTADSGRA